MKKTLAMLLASTMMLSMLASCSSSDSGDTGSTGGTTGGTTTTTPSGGDTTTSTVDISGADLMVVTSYGGDDGNRQNYDAAYQAFAAATGVNVIDTSTTADESWKATVNADFETGAEPDVLFYFAGVDADAIINGGGVVSIDTIRSEYPSYANNMKDSLLPVSPADGKQYAVPVNGYWEGLFVNTAVLADAGVEVPGADYTWDQFLVDCQTLKDAGYTPIAASLHEVPHYWFEFTVLNNGSMSNHLDIPASSADAAGQKWAAGLNDIKDLYERGFFPSNTLTASDAETVQLMADNEAAFLIDGNWKIGWFEENANIEDFIVTYVPGKGDRVASDVVGGLSMGYFITQKAWDDPITREAAVQFVTAMTTDEVVSQFGATALTALKNPTTPPSDLSPLALSAIAMTSGTTGTVGAAQDGLTAEVRGVLFGEVKTVAAGNKEASAVLDTVLAG